MNRASFLTKFQINLPQTMNKRYRYPAKVRAASVLIPLIDGEDGLEVLFTIRALHLKHHAGQVSFPGGKQEESDDDAVAAALRESEEEIGLKSDSIEVVGQLNPYQTISGFQVTPIVGMISKLPTLLIDEGEVSEVFTAPLAFFLDSNNHITVPVKTKQNQYSVHFMPYRNYNIWGATAAMLKDLAEHLI